MSRLVLDEHVPFYQMRMENSLAGIMWPELEDDHTSISNTERTSVGSIVSAYPI